jgi:hypothetical protein
MLPQGEDSTGLVYGSANYGFPIADVVRLGGQIGGRVTARDNDPDWLASAGIFQRGVQLGTADTAWAVQGVYQDTWAKADIISLKPTFGVQVREYDYVAVTGVWGITEEHVGPATQQPVDQAMLLYGAEWNDQLRTEVGAGYEFQNLDTIQLGAHAGYMLDKTTSINCTYAADFEGNYYAALSLGFDMGGTGRNATFNNVKSDDGYTPFPMGSLPVVFYETQLRPIAPVEDGGGDDEEP